MRPLTKSIAGYSAGMFEPTKSRAEQDADDVKRLQGGSPTRPVITVDTAAGTSIRGAAETALAGARRTDGPVGLRFNDRLIPVGPNEAWEDTVDRYHVILAGLRPSTPEPQRAPDPPRPVPSEWVRLPDTAWSAPVADAIARHRNAVEAANEVARRAGGIPNRPPWKINMTGQTHVDLSVFPPEDAAILRDVSTPSPTTVDWRPRNPVRKGDGA